MPEIHTEQYCKQCSKNGNGKYCADCGQTYAVKRITIASVVHEMFHFFTHLDKGFLYTLKMLLVSPGQPQKDYVEGQRSKFQKPFSMFFLCVTAAMFLQYWTNLMLIKHFDAGNADDANFFHQYMVIFQVLMLPVYSLITYCFFLRSKYNYAETFVLLLYNLSFVLVVTGLMQPLKFIWPHLETRYIELIFVVFYNLTTNLKFYEGEVKWLIFLRTLLASAVCFLLAGQVQDSLIDFLFSHQ